MDRGLLRGIALICASVGLIGVSYGAVATAAGFPLWLPVLTAVCVLAASAEFLFLGIVAGGGDPFAAMLAGLLVNARHLPYGLAIPEVIEPGWRRVVGTHLMNDESVVVALAQPDLPRKRAAYWLCGLGIFAAWPAGALLGGTLGSLASPDTFGLDAMFPAVIMALILPALRDKPTRNAAALGAAIALGTAPFLPSGLPELLALAAVAVAARKRPKVHTEEEPEAHPEVHTAREAAR